MVVALPEKVTSIREGRTNMLGYTPTRRDRHVQNEGGGERDLPSL